MLFHVTQTHAPELCPRDEGGSKTLYDPEAEGVTLRARYLANAEHTMYYIVEADSMKALNQFLLPGFKRCDCQITPVSEESLIK